MILFDNDVDGDKQAEQIAIICTPLALKFDQRLCLFSLTRRMIDRTACSSRNDSDKIASVVERGEEMIVSLCRLSSQIISSFLILLRSCIWNSMLGSILPLTIDFFPEQIPGLCSSGMLSLSFSFPFLR